MDQPTTNSNNGGEPSGTPSNGESRPNVELTKKITSAEETEKKLQDDKLLDTMINGVIEKKEGAGRPSILTAQVVRKLIGAFQNGMNDTIACHYARISRESFYRHMKENQAFADIIQDARDSVAILSGQTVVEVIRSGDDRVRGPLAFKMLERLARDKYGTDNNVVINNNVAYKPPSWFSNPDNEVLAGEEVLVDKK